MLWAILLIPNNYALSIFLYSAENLRALVHEYLIVFVWRFPLYLMFFAWQILIRTDGFAKVVRRGILTGQITNVILSFALVSNGFGVTGAAVALISGDVIATIYIAKKYFSSDDRLRNFCPVLNDFGKFINQVERIDLANGIKCNYILFFNQTFIEICVSKCNY